MVALGIGPNRPGGNTVKARVVEIGNAAGASVPIRRSLSNSTVTLTSGSDSDISIVGNNFVTAVAIAAGTAKIIYVKEDAGNGVTATYPVTLLGKGVAVIPAVLPAATVGVAYSYALPFGTTVVWDNGPPPGFTFNAANSTISGTY